VYKAVERGDSGPLLDIFPRLQEKTKAKPQSIRIRKKSVNFKDTMGKKNQCNNFTIRARLDTEDKPLY